MKNFKNIKENVNTVKSPETLAAGYIYISTVLENKLFNSLTHTCILDKGIFVPFCNSNFKSKLKNKLICKINRANLCSY